jgi:hypothetical protein
MDMSDAMDAYNTFQPQGQAPQAPMGQPQGLSTGLGGLSAVTPQTQLSAYGNFIQNLQPQQNPQAAAMQQYQQALAQPQFQPPMAQQNPQAAAMQQYQQALAQTQPQQPPALSAPPAPTPPPSLSSTVAPVQPPIAQQAPVQPPMNRPVMPPPKGPGAPQQVRPENNRMQAMRRMQRMAMMNQGRFN